MDVYHCSTIANYVSIVLLLWYIILMQLDIKSGRAFRILTNVTLITLILSLSVSLLLFITTYTYSHEEVEDRIEEGRPHAHHSS